MDTEAKVFPDLQINLFADMHTFVVRWDSMFAIDESYEFYLEHRYKKELTEKELLKLFEWFNRGKLGDADLQVFFTEVAPRLSLINEFKRKEDYISIYSVDWDIKLTWFAFIMHLIGGGPLFDENIFRAYHYINTAEIKDLPEDYDGQCEQHTEYTVFYFDKEEKLNYGYTDDMWDNALWVLGKFLKEYPNLFMG